MCVFTWIITGLVKCLISPVVTGGLNNLHHFELSKHVKPLQFICIFFTALSYQLVHDFAQGEKSTRPIPAIGLIFAFWLHGQTINPTRKKHWLVDWWKELPLSYISTEIQKLLQYISIYIYIINSIGGISPEKLDDGKTKTFFVAQRIDFELADSEGNHFGYVQAGPRHQL